MDNLYQLAAHKNSHPSQYQNATKLLFVPDLLGYWLTGQMVCERTFASTSQFYNPVTRDWAYDLLEKLNIRTDLFAELVDPGTIHGEVEGMPLVKVGSHDTASAFAAAPVKDLSATAVLSSGTWSLLGAELDQPIISDDACKANFTNEVGVCDTIRFLKNLSGLWVIQELRRVWAEKGIHYSWNEMDSLAEKAPPFSCFIDPSHPDFTPPGDMEQRVIEQCRRIGQAYPENHGQVIRSLLEGLAFLYAKTLNTMEGLTGKSFKQLCVVGGGAKNKTLNTFTANAIGRRVITGPKEATAVGNLIIQMKSLSHIKSLGQGREIIFHSFAQEVESYLPKDKANWADAYQKWYEVTKQ
ncbi:MAG: rhamnulokinase [Planctomycetes bacterium]|nr:rhamnulokinase [Planctomycetota bacterium]